MKKNSNMIDTTKIRQGDKIEMKRDYLYATTTTIKTLKENDYILTVKEIYSNGLIIMAEETKKLHWFKAMIDKHIPQEIVVEITNPITSRFEILDL